MCKIFNKSTNSPLQKCQKWAAALHTIAQTDRNIFIFLRICMLVQCTTSCTYNICKSYKLKCYRLCVYAIYSLFFGLWNNIF